MQRRTLLKAITGVVSGVWAAALAVPAIRFVLAPLRRTPAERPLTRRITTLDQLASGQPKQFPIFGDRHDAWTRYPREIIGRVWLVRSSDAQTPPQDTKVDALTAECPHLGCVVDWDSDKADFICPCHQAAFTAAGKAISSAKLGYDNPAPRDLDRLACRVVRDGTTGQWWVEVDFERFQIGLTDRVPV